MEQNIYSAPQSDVLPETEVSMRLASRWSRLWASLLDTLVMMLIILPVMYFTGVFESISKGEPLGITDNLISTFFGVFVFLLINGSLLTRYGQTIGKKALRIKIVDLDGSLPTWKKHLGKRYATYFLPGQIPLIGQFFSIINILFIFGKQKRCIHDLAAGTMVVSV